MVGKAICGDAQALKRLRGKEEETESKQYNCVFAFYHDMLVGSHLVFSIMECSHCLFNRRRPVGKQGWRGEESQRNKGTGRGREGGTKRGRGKREGAGKRIEGRKERRGKGKGEEAKDHWVT